MATCEDSNVVRNGRESAGWIYFVQCCGPEGPVKIGHASNVERRMAEIQGGNPYELTLLAAIKVPNRTAVETFVHGAFSSSHMRGEWFRHTPELADLVRRALAWSDDGSVSSWPVEFGPHPSMTGRFIWRGLIRTTGKPPKRKDWL